MDTERDRPSLFILAARSFGATTRVSGSRSQHVTGSGALMARRRLLVPLWCRRAHLFPPRGIISSVKSRCALAGAKKSTLPPTQPGPTLGRRVFLATLCQ